RRSGRPGHGPGDGHPISGRAAPRGAARITTGGQPSGERAVDDRADPPRRSAAALVDQAAGRPLVVFVDDAHLLEDASATLVHQLAVTRAAFLLATAPSGESA